MVSGWNAAEWAFLWHSQEAKMTSWPQSKAVNCSTIHGGDVLQQTLSVSWESTFTNVSMLPNSDMAPPLGEQFHTQRVTALGDPTCHIAHSWLCRAGCNWWGTLQCITWESSAPNELKGFVIPTTGWGLASHHAWLLSITAYCGASILFDTGSRNPFK